MQLNLVLATRNKGKVEELRHLLEGLPVSVASLDDYPDVPEVVEDGKTFLDNARKKAREVAATIGEWTLADDSGLVVEALGGGPSIYSARYAGKNGDHEANNEKLLREMKKIPADKRQAAFVCTMVLASPDGREWDVEKRCEGEITFEPRGSGGFGYDPLFYIPAFGKTMAELTIEEKNSISHRGKALRAIKDILLEILG